MEDEKSEVTIPTPALTEEQIRIIHNISLNNSYSAIADVAFSCTKVLLLGWMFYNVGKIAYTIIEKD